MNIDNDENQRHRVHLKMLGMSGNSKEFGDLTVVPLGHAVSIAVDLLAAQRQTLRDEVLEKVDGLYTTAPTIDSETLDELRTAISTIFEGKEQDDE